MASVMTDQSRDKERHSMAWNFLKRRRAPEPVEEAKAASRQDAETPGTPVPVRAVPFVARKASATGPVTAPPGGTRPVWGSRDAATLARAGFIANPVGFRSVKLVAEAAAALPLICQDASRRYEMHPVLDLLRRPNTVQGRAEFLEALYGQLLLTGNAYVEAVGGGGLPIELHVLRSDRMSVVPGPDGWPVAFEYTVGARRHRFGIDPERPLIFHVRSFHPQDDHYGLSPLSAAASALEVHNAASRWSKALLDNAARPSGALVYTGEDGGGTLTTEQYDRLLSEMEMLHQGARNAGRPMLLEGGLDWKPMGFSPSDMEFQKTKEAAAREIAMAFGVPPMLLGIPGDATYANYQEANRAFYRGTVLPLATRVTAALSDWLSRFDPERVVELRPDPDLIPALGPEREAAWRRVGEADFLSDAEKRSLLGLPAQIEGVAE
jgi:HK97 family phage portal protein